MSIATRASLGAILCLLPGCMQSASDDAESAAAPIVGVRETTLERPEIGHFGNCTGTLIAPKVVLSAAHCFDYESGARALGDYTIDLADGTHRTFAAVEVIVYGTRAGTRGDDLALVRLRDAVPAAVATPGALASETPARGERVTMWGYGCTSRPLPRYDGDDTVVVSTAGDELAKRKFEYTSFETTSRGCPGDSGGPRTRASGAVFEVNSAYYQDRDIPVEGPDRSADVVGHHAELARQVATWSR